MSLPFTATTPVLLPLEAFPEHLHARVRKLPMWDADRDMLIMKVQSQREYLEGLRQKVQENKDRGSKLVQGAIEPVMTTLLHYRRVRLQHELAWEEALLVRNDLLLQEAQ